MAVVIEGRRRVEVGGVALAVLAVIAGAVLWSNALQYHAVFLAPSSRLMELEKIGSTYSGQGPALLTEFEPYAARHFLRGLNGEAASELRVHPVHLRGAPGREAHFGVSPDLDEIKLDESSALKANAVQSRMSAILANFALLQRQAQDLPRVQEAPSRQPRRPVRAELFGVQQQ